MHLSTAEDSVRSAQLALHRPPLDVEEAREVAGLLRRLHFPLGAAAAEEGVEPALCEAFVGLLDRLVHGGKRGAGGRREPEAERGEVFKSNFPASALITAKDFAVPQLLVEIQAIAVVGERN